MTINTDALFENISEIVKSNMLPQSSEMLATFAEKNGFDKVFENNQASQKFDGMGATESTKKRIFALKGENDADILVIDIQSRNNGENTYWINILDIKNKICLNALNYDHTVSKSSEDFKKISTKKIDWRDVEHLRLPSALSHLLINKM